MKTAVSIPDDVFLRAEELAEQTNRTRSRLYSDALGEYLARHGTDAPGNVLLPAGLSGLPSDSVANVSQIVTLDRAVFSDHVGRLPETLVELVLAGINVVLGR